MRLVTVKNPFNPRSDRVIETINIDKGITVEQLSKERAIPNTEIKIVVNGAVREGHELIQKNDFVVISPVVAKGGKQIFAMVAMIALAVVAPQIGVWGANALNGVGTAALTTATMGITGGLIAASVMFLGAYLISRFVTTKTDTGNYDSSSDPSYSWSGTTVMEGQNNAVQVIYGKVKTSGQSIGKYISTLDNKEYLNWLLCLGEGPLNISNVLINDNEAAYYTDLSVETRPGTNEQSVISNFNDTYASTSLGYLLTTTERIQTVQGNATQGIKVNVEFSNGLYYAEDSGSLSEAWVTLECDYRLVGTTAWNNLISPNTKISGNVSSAIRKEFRVDGLTAGSYEVRMYVTGRSHDENSSRASTKCYWTTVTSIVYDDFSYPCKALLAIKALATDQISGSPSVSCIVERPTVFVYNPHTAQYEEKASNNPAWACYDCVHQARSIKNINTGAYEIEVRGANADLMLYDQFAEWATFCDDKNLHINWIDDTVGKLMDKINQNMAPIGRGYVLWFGTKCGCIWDSVKEPTQMFGMGNIIAGTFKEDFLETTGRANCIELTYTDANANYERQTVTVYGDTFDTDDTTNTTQITYDGITSYEQAYRTAKYLLRCNQYLIRTVSFETGIDSISSTIGDCITVSHDIPKWARSGRIFAVSGNDLTLACEDLTNTTGPYRLMYRTVNDTMYEKAVTITSSSGGYTVVNVTAGLTTDDTPSANDIFDLALVSTGSKPFTITSITRASDFTRKITAIEYNEAIYSDSDTIPDIQYSEESLVPQNVINLKGNIVTYCDSAGTKHALLQASWELPSGAPACKYIVFTSTNGTDYTVLKSNISQPNINEEVLTDTSYFIKVVSVLGLKKSSGTISSLIQATADALPPDVTAFDHELLADGTRRYWWKFDYPTPNDIAGFRIRYLQGTSISWNAGTDVNSGLVTTQPYETRTIRHGTHTVMIKAVDNAGQESQNMCYCVVALGDPLFDNVLYTVDFSENSWAKAAHNGKAMSDGTIVSKQQGNFWATSSTAHWSLQKYPYWQEQRYKAFEMDMSFFTIASGQMWFDYQITGPAIIYYRKISANQSYWPNDEGTFYTTESDYAWKANNEIWKQYSTKIMVQAGEHVDIKIVSDNNVLQRTTIKSFKCIIDVPDRMEHFEDVTVPTTGLELDIKTPNYYTTGVRIDAVQGGATGILLLPTIVSRNPCVIRLYDTSGNAASATIDVTWQGYEKEVQ